MHNLNRQNNLPKAKLDVSILLMFSGGRPDGPGFKKRAVISGS